MRLLGTESEEENLKYGGSMAAALFLWSDRTLSLTRSTLSGLDVDDLPERGSSLTDSQPSENCALDKASSLHAFVNFVKVSVASVSYTHLDVYKRQLHLKPLVTLYNLSEQCTIFLSLIHI